MLNCLCAGAAVFCIYYISRGVLQENRQELVAFVLSVLVVMVRSLVNFLVQGSESKHKLLVGLSTHSICRGLLIMKEKHRLGMCG